MTPDERYEAWKRHRSRVEVPPDFADAVLARLPAGEPRPGPRWLRVAACTLAGAACLFRAAQVLGLFLPQ